jgi:hypothetical protein
MQRDSHFPLMDILGTPPPPCDNLKETTSEPSAGNKYIQKHDDYADNNELTQLNTFTKRQAAAKACTPKLKMPERMNHALMLKVAMLEQRGEAPADVPHIMAADQEVDRMSCQMNCAPCITPRGQFYLTTEQRFLTGRDFAALQGITRADCVHYKMQDMPDSNLKDLAGNAFSMPITIISILASLQDLRH